MLVTDTYLAGLDEDRMSALLEKQESFLDRGDNRLWTATESLRKLGDLFRSTGVAYTQEQVDYIFSKVDAEVERAKACAVNLKASRVKRFADLPEGFGPVEAEVEAEIQ
jgi:hypothetical protein